MRKKVMYSGRMCVDREQAQPKDAGTFPEDEGVSPPPAGVSVCRSVRELDCVKYLFEGNTPKKVVNIDGDRRRCPFMVPGVQRRRTLRDKPNTGGI